jgi:hypothetical protein
VDGAVGSEAVKLAEAGGVDVRALDQGRVVDARA